jgi:hypothetical protein
MSTGDDNAAGTAAGGSTDQHITGSRETGSFLTDEPPTPTTPAHGSSNAGINTRNANRGVPGHDAEAMTDDVADDTEPAQGERPGGRSPHH